ncbi:ABC transporter related protein, ATP binding subunit [Oleispira antarctica RB-8]|uniref:ABC transporter related protein, ATP binding subunit n=1 Tax=Oleispira antarctica RB-8 TaxID=698738 RepID=R4YL62_OLEAN|nr:ABC transporter related protein, ATP binding subunit [Oleispira antarctica RB-8]
MSALIECQNLTKAYGNKKALNNISFEIQSGQPIALVGPNGAGKSTLFGILAGYIPATSGEAKILGHNVGSPELIGRIGALPQDALFNPNLTIQQQLSFLARLQGFGRSKAFKEAARVLELMQLADTAKEKITALSHGMKKRVAIAQALMGEPELVLLDEPTAGLDPENARNIRQQVMALSDETTFVISSHNLEELERLCEQVLYLDQGELKAQHIIGQQTEQQTLSYLTVRLVVKNTAIVSNIKQLTAVSQIELKQGDELVIGYNSSENPILDQQLLQLLAQHKVPYRQITHGQSLEDQLFMK